MDRLGKAITYAIVESRVAVTKPDEESNMAPCKSLLLAFVTTAFVSLAYAGDPAYYQKKATWQETMLCSRQALVEWEADHPEINANAIDWGSWYRLGPVDCGAQGFSFLPDALVGRIHKSALDGAAAGWQQLRSHQDGAVTNLTALGNAATFLFRTVTAGSDMTHTIYLGSDDGIAVYLNGACLLANDCARGAAPNQDRVDLALKAGDNQWLLKIYNRGGGYSKNICIQVKREV